MFKTVQNLPSAIILDSKAPEAWSDLTTDSSFSLTS